MKAMENARKLKLMSLVEKLSQLSEKDKLKLLALLISGKIASALPADE